MHGIAHRLRNVYISPKSSGLRDSKQKRSSVVDQSAGIHISQRDYAIERSGHHLIAFHLLEPGDVGPGRGDTATLHQKRLVECIPQRRSSIGIAPGIDRFPALRPNHRIQDSPSLRRYARKFQVGLAFSKIGIGLTHRGPGLLQTSFRLVHLLIQFGGLDHCQRLSGSNPVAYIHHALLDIAVGPSKHRRFRSRLNIARQFQIAFSRRVPHFDNFHSRQGLLLVVRFSGDQRLRFCRGTYPAKNAMIISTAAARQITQIVSADGCQSFAGTPTCGEL